MSLPCYGLERTCCASCFRQEMTQGLLKVVLYHELVGLGLGCMWPLVGNAEGDRARAAEWMPQECRPVDVEGACWGH